MERFARNASQIFVIAGVVTLLLLGASLIVGQLWLTTIAAVPGGVSAQAWMTMKASNLDADG